MATVVIVIAGLMGAAGVASLAAAAHAAPGTGLDSAGHILLVHAAALVGVLALAGQGLAWRPAALVALLAFILGALMFSGDIALRAFAGHRLFAMAAPTGGVLLILGWIALAVAGLLRAS